MTTPPDTDPLDNPPDCPACDAGSHYMAVDNLGWYCNAESCPGARACVGPIWPTTPPNNTPGADNVDVEGRRLVESCTAPLAWALLGDETRAKMAAPFATALTTMYERGKREERERCVSYLQGMSVSDLHDRPERFAFAAMADDLLRGRHWPERPKEGGSDESP